jgi:hypothetical protein
MYYRLMSDVTIDKQVSILDARACTRSCPLVDIMNCVTLFDNRHLEVSCATVEK